MTQPSALAGLDQVGQLQDSFARLEQTIQTSEPAESHGIHLQTFLHLSRRIVSLAVSLDQEI